MLRPTALSLLFSVLTVGCSAGDPGIITITVEGLAGAEGKVLISQARNSDPGNASGGFSCISIDGDPFSATEPIRELLGDNPCDIGEPVQLEAGLYDVSTVVMTGGSQTSEFCATAQVDVDGDVEVTMPALEPCE